MSLGASDKSGKSNLDELPVPVASYLVWALPGRQRIRIVRIRQEGSLRTDVHSRRWLRFEAQHIAESSSIRFLWDARVHVAPLLYLRVRDSFADGKGAGEVRLLRVFKWRLTVAAQKSIRAHYTV